MAVFIVANCRCFSKQKVFFLSDLHFPLCLSVMDEIAGLLSKDRTSSQLLEAARHFRSDDRSAKRRKLLADSLVGLEDHSEMETREDDQEWFEGEGRPIG